MCDEGQLAATLHYVTVRLVQSPVHCQLAPLQSAFSSRPAALRLTDKLQFT